MRSEIKQPWELPGHHMWKLLPARFIALRSPERFHIFSPTPHSNIHSPAICPLQKPWEGVTHRTHQDPSLTGFYRQVLANSLRGNKVPGGPQLSSHVTFLALLQGHPVPRKVMLLLRKSLCHMWDRKSIYFEPRSSHSGLTQPFQELPGQQRKTSSERKDGSLCS